MPVRDARFRPHPLLRGGHAQTIAGFLFPGTQFPYRAVQHSVALDDGDTVILHEDHPPDWRPGDLTALMIHGLSGCHRSGYLQRLTAKLHANGVRSFRLDLRGSGAGMGLSQRPYNAGQSSDLLPILRAIDRMTDSSPCVLTGFSMGGNLALKLAGAHGDELPANIVRVVAINPPIDLNRAVQALQKPLTRFYDRYFSKRLHGQMQQYRDVLERLNIPLGKRPRGLFEFDCRFTAPLGGFKDASDYYAKSSSRPLLPRIKLPTHILTSADDPLIPVQCFDSLDLPNCVDVNIAPSGGHLGYLGRGKTEDERRWMDNQVLDWTLAAG